MARPLPLSAGMTGLIISTRRLARGALTARLQSAPHLIGAPPQGTTPPWYKQPEIPLAVVADRRFDMFDMNRRHLLGMAGTTLVGTALSPARGRAQTPKRGGTIALRLWDPPHFDPYLQVSYKTHIVYSFTHSRLVKYRSGPGVVPGTFAIEGDLAESWSQPDETTYVFKLRRGVRWQPKPPVNGRELTAEDVVYSVDRFRTIKGNANASMLKSVDRVEAI